MKRQDLLQRAVDRWGADAQMMMAVEEMAELTQALSKVYRKGTGGSELWNLLEEIADVRIMLDQLAVIFVPIAQRSAFFDPVAAEDAKLTRLAHLLGQTYEPTSPQGQGEKL